MFPAFFLEQMLKLLLPFTNVLLFIGRVDGDLAVATPDLFAVGCRTVDALLRFLLDELPPVNRMCFQALSAFEADSMSEEFELVPSSTVGIGQIDLCCNATGYQTRIRTCIICGGATRARNGKASLIQP